MSDKENAIRVLNLYGQSTLLEVSEGVRNDLVSIITIEEFIKAKETAIKALKDTGITEEQVQALRVVMGSAVEGANSAYIVNKTILGKEAAKKELQSVSNSLLILKKMMEEGFSI